jgi:uncharacterized iron-regulated membrane protein
LTFKKAIGKIHLWLGLTAGLVVLLLGITGCILAFEIEIRQLTETYRKAEPKNKTFLPPSAIKKIAEQHLVSKEVKGIEYPGLDKAAVASYWDADNYEVAFIDPYDGKVLKHKNMNDDFFRIVLDGHFYLWLPPEIGQPIAASATLVFVLMMITGLILWWPKNKAAAKQRFSIKWSTRWRRKNYDLHNVLGFYMTWVAVFIALTGLVWGFEWFAESAYWVTSGGRQMEANEHPLSDTTAVAAYPSTADHLWQRHLPAVKPSESIAVYFASENTDPIEVVINHQPGTYYDSDFYHYDQYTGKELHAKGPWDGEFDKAKVADKIVRMNYDMHTGAVLGLPGKIAVFFASLIAASLPVTGFMIWWGRKKKRKKDALAASAAI